MREIKFRAWDKVAQNWLRPYPDGFHILGETTCFDLIGQQLRERSPDIPTLEMLNDVEIVQFTGLLDKSGKEIYEGDIVKRRISNRQHHVDDYVDIVGEIAWGKWSWGIKTPMFHAFDAIMARASVVIGNKFENAHEFSELLEAKSTSA